MWVSERERERNDKKKVNSPESFRGHSLLRLRKGVGGGVGELQGGQDHPHQTMTKTMATGKAAEETVLATKHEGAFPRASRLVKSVMLLKSFFFLLFFKGVELNPRYSDCVMSRPDCTLACLWGPLHSKDIKTKLFNIHIMYLYICTYKQCKYNFQKPCLNSNYFHYSFIEKKKGITTYICQILYKQQVIFIT